MNFGGPVNVFRVFYVLCWNLQRLRCGVFLSADIVVGVPIRLGAKPVAANDIVKLAELAVSASHVSSHRAHRTKETRRLTLSHAR